MKHPVRMLYGLPSGNNRKRSETQFGCFLGVSRLQKTVGNLSPAFTRQGPLVRSQSSGRVGFLYGTFYGNVSPAGLILAVRGLGSANKLPIPLPPLIEQSAAPWDGCPRLAHCRADRLACSAAQAFLLGSKNWSLARADAAHWRWEFLFGEFAALRSLRI